MEFGIKSKLITDMLIEILAATVLKVGCFRRSYGLGCIELKGLFSHRNSRNGDSFRDLPIKAHLIHFKKLQENLFEF